MLTIRTYATPGRPKRVVGEPSKPVKRAVKKKAAQPADGSSAAEQQVAAKKSTAAKNTRKTLTPEQKAAKKEQVAAKQAAAKVAAEERLEKQKAVQQKRKANAKVEAQKAKVKELKKVALSPPPKVRPTAYNIFLSEKMKELLTQRSEAPVKEHFLNASREMARMWKEANATDVEVRI